MKPLAELVCLICEKTFTRPTSVVKAQLKKGQKAFYCSRRCAGVGASPKGIWLARLRIKALQPLAELMCPICGKRFRRQVSYVNRQLKKGQKVFYCSCRCASRKQDWLARRMKALNLRNQGLTFEEIGKQLGVTRSGAHHIYKMARNEEKERPSPSSATTP